MLVEIHRYGQAKFDFVVVVFDVVIHILYCVLLYYAILFML